MMMSNVGIEVVKNFKDNPGNEIKSSDNDKNGKKEKYTLFYKDSPFSQQYAVKFTVDGIIYKCVEQLMIHQKASEYSFDYYVTILKIYTK